MKAFVFPGQGAQFVGMGKDLYENNPLAKELFDKANEVLGFKITDIMFEGTADELKQTKVTQPAVFLHSVISALCMGDDFQPAMVAGHSLGEFSALVAAGALTFEDGLRLVYARAMAMQKACEAAPGTMAAIIGLPDEKVEEICAAVSTEQSVVIPEATEFAAPKCPVYQNYDAKPHTDPAEIKANLIAQLTGSVRWTASVQNMIADGADEFTECGPGKALQGMIGRIDKSVSAHGIE